MTVDAPLTGYICGETKDEKTVDMIGCLHDQDAARERFEEKHGKEPDSYLYVCDDCRDDNPNYAENIEQKYGVIGPGYENVAENSS